MVAHPPRRSSLPQCLTVAESVAHGASPHTNSRRTAAGKGTLASPVALNFCPQSQCFLRAALIGHCIFGAPSSYRTTCVADQPSGLPPTNFRLSSEPASSSFALRPASDLRRLPTLRTLPSSLPPACAFDLLSSFALRLTVGSRRRSVLRLCLPTQLPTLYRILHLPASLVGSNARPAPNLAFCSSAFRPASSLRLPPTFQLHLPTDCRLAPTIRLPDLPSEQLPTVIEVRLSALLPTDRRLASPLLLPACFRTNLRLPPDIAFMDFAFRSADGLRRLPTL
jgi:hypothetical protein